MIKHHLILFLRNINKNKSTFLINLIGLSTGLACVLLIYLWVNDELSVDTFHENGNRLYQVMQNFHNPDGIQTVGSSPVLLAKALTAEMPEVEYAVTVNNGINRKGILMNDDNHTQASGLYASSDFFRMFSYHLVQGDARYVLTDRNAIVLSEEMATSLFGTTEDVVGKTVKTNPDLMDETFVVSGIFESPPGNSTMQFDFIINFEMAFSKFAWINEWSADDAKTYLTLKEGVDVGQFNEKMRDFLLSKPDRGNNKLFVQRYSARYLYGQYENGVPAGGRVAYVRLFSIVGVFILIIACINFMNLSTAQASRKMKEVGVKKAMGISRKKLAVQFLVESIFITFLSLIIAFLLFELLLPQVNEITGKNLNITIDAGFILSVAGFAFFVGILSGIYPAFYLSGFDPVTILKGGKFSTSFGELWVRRGLVIIQFTLSVVFITGFLIINEQIEFVQNRDLGYSKENVIHFNMRGRYNRETFLSELKRLPGVINAANTHGGSIVEMRGSGTGFTWGGRASDNKAVFRRPQVGYDFIETLGIDVIAGRTFSRAFGDEGSKLIVNEAAAEIIGKEDIVGKMIMDGDVQKQIIGVVQNFNIKSLHENMQPCIIRFEPGGNDFMVRLNPKYERTTIEDVKNLYGKFNSEYPFEFTFIDDSYQALYVSEERVAVLSKYFMVIAIIISCLGLFGLASFTAERRTREIGIRKILGAGVFGLVRLLTGEFIAMVLIAITIAIPASYFIGKQWLSEYAYRIDLQWWMFVGAGQVAVMIAIVTVSWQSIKTALMNPVNSLRSE